MPYTSSINRSDAQSLIPEDVSKDIIEGAIEQSAVLTLGNRAPDMPRNVRRLPVLDLLPSAYFVSGDTGYKQTTKQKWADKYIYAEELAVIIPIPEVVLSDTSYDIWGSVRPRLREAFGIALDAAVFYGTNAPANWPDGIVPDAVAAGNVVALSTVVGAGGDLYDAVLGVGGVYEKIEIDGFQVTGNVAPLTMKSKIRGLRDANNLPIFTRVPGMMTNYEFDGTPIMFPRNGALDPSQSLLIAGDWSELMYAFRQDITYKMITEGVITDSAGNIVYNLPQQDMVALRAVMRIGWQVPNPINRLNSSNSTRYPFAVLTP